MRKEFCIKIIKGKSIIFAIICSLACLGFIIVIINVYAENDLITVQKQNSNYVILAVNDLGMHCYQRDFSNFLILPPGNNLRVQVVRNNGKEAELVNSGIEVSYRMIENSTSADKINFWEYTKNYGYDVAPDVGITGNTLSGKMELSTNGLYYEATAIPVTPYNDGSTKLNPYQLASVIITDKKSGSVLAMINDVVIPVSNEMECGICHGSADTDMDILKSHDELSGTLLVSDLEKGIRYKCSDCHKDNILTEPGKTGVLPLSQAIHGFHAGKMTQSDLQNKCYSCHPGPVSQCYRGIMYADGINCADSKCHGDMYNIAQTQAQGRQAWLEEPDCSNCHEDKYGVNTNKLYSNSYLLNNENDEMNGFILCISCHNGPHAEWKSTNQLDNMLPKRLLGYSSYINKCTVCHNGTGIIHSRIQNK